MVASLRTSPPSASPASRPAPTALANMRRLSRPRFAGQPLPDFREGLVGDRRKVARFERGNTMLLDDALECPHDLRVELDRLVLVELLQRALVTDLLAIDAVGGHGLVRVCDEEDPTADRDLLADQSFGIAGPVVMLVVMEHDRNERTQLLGWFE